MKILPYDMKWQKVFILEKNLIQAALSGAAKSLEHIGSTAIPGMPSKPIIDIAVLVASIKRPKKFTEQLKKIGYKLDNKRSSSERLFFVKGQPVQFHLSLTQRSVSFWKRQISFRDYLIENDDMAREYAELKLRLIKQHPSGRGGYSEGKTDFVKEVLARVGN